MILRMLQGNTDALAMILDIHRIVEVWDDLLDKDKPVSDSALNATIAAALITLPRNPFYARNFNLLSPILEMAIMDWHAASELERIGGEALRTSYALRCAFYALTVMAAKIIGGAEWAQKVSVELRQAGMKADPWADYAEEHGVA